MKERKSNQTQTTNTRRKHAPPYSQGERQELSIIIN